MPKSRGGTGTVPLHPICHRNLHAIFDNKRLAAIGADRAALLRDPDLARFLAWIDRRDPDFHAPTRARR